MGISLTFLHQLADQSIRKMLPISLLYFIYKPYNQKDRTVFIYGRPFVSKLWHDIRAVFSHVYLQSFLLHDVRAFLCHVYLRFIPKYMTIFLQTRIYMRTKKTIYMRYKQACGICGRRKWSYKRHRIIPVSYTHLTLPTKRIV